MKKIILTLATSLTLFGSQLIAEETANLDVKGGALAEAQVSFPDAFMDANGGIFVLIGGVLFAVMGSGDSTETTLATVDTM